MRNQQGKFLVVVVRNFLKVHTFILSLRGEDKGERVISLVHPHPDPLPPAGKGGVSDLIG